jgi:hypothetical protein
MPKVKLVTRLNLQLSDSEVKRKKGIDYFSGKKVPSTEWNPKNKVSIDRVCSFLYLQITNIENSNFCQLFLNNNINITSIFKKFRDRNIIEAKAGKDINNLRIL